MKIVTRKEAISKGLELYFTGKACKNGVVTTRKTSRCCCQCDECIEQHKQKYKTYRQNNSEKVKQYFKQRYENSPEHVKEIKKKSHSKPEVRANLTKGALLWKQRNSDKVKLSDKKYRQSNRQLVLERNRLWRENNPDKVRNCVVKRELLESNASCLQSELTDFVYKEVYSLCKLRESLTGFKWHIDHMIPLKGKNVSGLHVWNNFQSIPATINTSKQNKLIYTNPFEWLNDLHLYFKVVE